MMLNLLSRLTGSQATEASSIVKRALEAMRRHLEMDVAYVSRIVGNESVFEEVDAPGLSHLIAVGDRRSLDDVYCRHILEGRLPELIRDTSREPIAAAMPLTRLVPIGAHVSVPIRRADGEVYGMFCCLSATPRPSLNERDLHIFRAFAGLVAEEIDRDLGAREIAAEKTRRIQQVLQSGGPAIALQPIVSLIDNVVVGYEALARFAGEPHRSPDIWFAEAAETGLGVELECLTIATALRTLDWLPDDLSLSLNISPTTAISAQLATILEAAPCDRLVLEVTEHSLVQDYEALQASLEPHRKSGAGLAIDDAGAGFSSLQHILKLQPDSIKLDMSLTRGIESDPARQALAAAMVMFARRTGAVLVAEGIETEDELAMLKALGVARGQGYLLGTPRIVSELEAEYNVPQMRRTAF